MTTFAPAGTYTVDATHSTVGFIARHLVISKVRGNFNVFEGTIVVGESIEQSSLTASVQANSITTHNDFRDGHLRSNDFLAAEEFPTLNLVSTGFTSAGDGSYVLTADLTIRDVTKSVDFDVEFLGAGPSTQEGVTAIGFEARTAIDRRDFNVNFEGNIENGSAVVSHKIELVLEIQAHSQA
jgi:polyisoprenoid-binding protein YceI